MPTNHSHRSGGLRQSNKKNKRSRASKRSVSRAAGGRVNVKAASAAALLSQSRADRRHKGQQRRESSRRAVISKRRGLDGGAAPPRVIGIISLGESGAELEEQVRKFALKTADKVFQPDAKSETMNTVTAKYNSHKKDGTLTFLTNSTAFGENTRDDAAVMAALDLCRVCDMILFVIDGNGPNPDDDIPMQIGGDAASVSTKKSVATQEWDHIISQRGDRILAGVKAQGLPTSITVLAKTATDQLDADHMTMKSAKSVRRSALKRKQDLKKYVGRFANTEFGVNNDKVVEIDLTLLEDKDDNLDEEENELFLTTASDSPAALVRTLCTMSASPPKWVSEAFRPYIVSDRFAYDENAEQLAITGYIRGKAPWDINSLIHIPNLGTFACKGAKRAQEPFTDHVPLTTDDQKVLLSDPMKRESLDMFASPDSLMGEQNLVGFDEAFEEEEEDEEKDAAPRPAGWSDYQSSWLDAVDDMSAGAGEFDRGELAKELNQKKSSSASTVGGMDLDDDFDVSPEERRALIAQRRKNHEEDREFPDEVDVPEDLKASDRFARYRSLKSFRKSYWDPKESLPESYSSIYHFRSFKGTQRDVMADVKDVTHSAHATMGNFWGSSPAAMLNKMEDDEDSEEEEDLLDGCIPSGSYVTLLVERVSPKAYARVAQQGILCGVALLPHENKATVLHMGLCQSAGCNQIDDIPVKSKDILTLRCGWRTWKARPVFSQNNLNSDKHKFERFLPREGAFFAASAFGPVTYTPSPVLVFRERQDTDHFEMVALGSILNANADRIVVKRIVLTGFPTRVHKRTATVKYMFYNPDDVRWFKPADLHTKHGLNGHIIESNGEHGTMKCLFNAPIKQHDTVCLPLYKRIYPKFANTIPSSADGATVKTAITKDCLVVL